MINQIQQSNYNENPFLVIWEVTRACAYIPKALVQ